MKGTTATVTRGRAAVDEKRDEVLIETGKTLDLVVAAVRPALPALVQCLPVSGLKRAGPAGESAVEEHTFLQLEGVDVRGAHVTGDYVPVEDLPNAPRGKLRGAASGSSRVGTSSPSPSRAPGQSRPRWRGAGRQRPPCSPVAR